MIGVLADDAEHSVVSELFELFKTPWEFYRSNSRCDVLICSGKQVQDSSAKLVLIYGMEQKAFDRENGIEILSRRSNTVLSYREDQIPVYRQGLTFHWANAFPLIEAHTREPAACQLASPGRTPSRSASHLLH